MRITGSGNSPGATNHFNDHVRHELPPFVSFVRDETIGSLLLLGCALIAMIIANSPLAEAYWHTIELPLKIKIGSYGVEGTLLNWINEGLMVLFFFVLGLEIKRELLVGELRDIRRAFPVVTAAIGGMLAPALIYCGITAGTGTVHGWGIPMTTDTAFAVGVLALLGSRVPIGMAVFVTALAIIDDIGAILVIAVFYSPQIEVRYLGMALVAFAGLVVFNMSGVRHPAIYLLVGILLWISILGSGVHTTLAGVISALAVPARPLRPGRWLPQRVRHLISDFEAREHRRRKGGSILADDDQHRVIEQIERAVEQASTPLQRWERALERPVALLVLPMFALMNAGVQLGREDISTFWNKPLTLGIIAGLVVGKLIGITGGAWLALRLGVGRLPEAMTMKHIVGIGLLGGMGFTMSVFIATLGVYDQQTLQTAKLAIIVSSLIAGLSSYFWLRACGKDATPYQANPAAPA
jgi:Na+:H+ antiporter, NhaA family